MATATGINVRTHRWDTSQPRPIAGRGRGVPHGLRNVVGPSRLSDQVPRTHSSKPDYAVNL